MGYLETLRMVEQGRECQAKGKVRAISPDGPLHHLGDLVQVCHQNETVEVGEVQALTRVEPPSLKPGYWYLVACSSTEAWVHESLVEPVPTAGDEEKP